MFELDSYDPDLHAEGGVRGSTSCTPLNDIAEMSFLFWSEHCVECAAPDCYASCALYQSRPDGRCRRLVYGIHKNRRFRSRRRYGAEVSFKTWGKLKTNGNTRMESVRVLMWKERLFEALAPALRVLGPLLSAITGDPRWKDPNRCFDRYARRLHRRPGRSRPDLFLLEAYNPSPDPVKVQLGMRIGEDLLERSVNRRRLPTPFSTTVTLTGGYSRHEIERHRFAAVTEAGRPFKLTLTPEGEGAVTLVFLTLDFVTRRRQGSADHRRHDSPGVSIKCVVFDLDGTLWDGVLIENDDVRPRASMVRAIERLDARGILLSVVSKNDHQQAWRKLEGFGLAEYFLHPRIDWWPKSDNIRRIAQDLNIGLDSVAFVDDSAFERAEVSRALPEVTCVAAADVGAVLDDPRFEGGASDDVKNRRAYYKNAVARDQERGAHGDDYLGFLRSSAIRLEISPYRGGDLGRVVELAQRTNQLNFSGTKYTPDAIARRLDDPDLIKHVLRCSDRFGSYGTVGLALVRRRGTEIRVEELMVSCRVQGRFVERAFFGHLARSRLGEGATSLWVNFRPSERNRPAERTLRELEFRPRAGADGLFLDLCRASLSCDFIEVVDDCSALA